MNNSTPNEKSVSKQSFDTEDFLAFSDDSKPSEFSPSVSSSPYKSWINHSRNNSSYNNWNNRRNLSYNSPNASSQNRSFHNSFEHKQQKSFYKPNRSFNSKSERFQSGKNSYLHPSFMENPWEKLEKQLEELNNQEKED